MIKPADNTFVLCLTLALLCTMSTIGLASPPVPPPPAGLDISLFADVEVVGDLKAEQSMTWTWVHDSVPEGRVFNVDTNGDGVIDSTFTVGGSNLSGLATGGRAAQIHYSNEVDAIDGLIEFKNSFDATSDTEPTLKVSKDFGFVASEASLIATAMDHERVGVSIVANGDTGGFGDMSSLCPWAQGRFIPATNEFIAAGSDTLTTSLMVSHTDSDVTATGPPSLNHKISAQGIGMAQGLMKLSLMEGDSMYSPEVNAHSHNPLWPSAGTGFPGTPNLQSKTTYSEKTQAIGTIEKFTKGMHYHSTIPVYQMPDPWYLLQ